MTASVAPQTKPAAPAPSRFDVSHVERIADELRDRLNSQISYIAENQGQVSYGHDRCQIQDLSDEEVIAYARGLYSAASNLADWLEHGWDDGGERSQAVRMKGASCAQIEAAILGAVGECLHRRNPERKAFAGRLRKFNAAISAIRSARVKINDFPVGSQEASDLGYAWLMDDGQKINLWLIEMDYQPKDAEQLAALERCRREMRALEEFIRHVRDYAHECRMREIERQYRGKAMAA